MTLVLESSSKRQRTAQDAYRVPQHDVVVVDNDECGVEDDVIVPVVTRAAALEATVCMFDSNPTPALPSLLLQQQQQQDDVEMRQDDDDEEECERRCLGASLNDATSSMASTTNTTSSTTRSRVQRRAQLRTTRSKASSRKRKHSSLNGKSGKSKSSSPSSSSPRHHRHQSRRSPRHPCHAERPQQESIAMRPPTSISTAPESRNLLLQVLGAPVHELGHLSVVSRLGWSLPLPAITKVIRKAHLLTSLSFFSLGFQGNKRDFDAFCRALRNHPSLVDIHLVDCCLEDQSIPLDALLSALADIPTLETVEIHAFDLDRETTIELISPVSLGELCESRSITSMDFQDLDFKKDHIQAMVKSLKTNDTLQELTMWDCNISDTSGQVLADMLQVNTCLQKVNLPFNDLRDASFQALARALCHNQTLQSLSLCGNTHLVSEKRGEGSGYNAVVKVLRDSNHSIEEIMMLESPVDPSVTLSLAINKNRAVLEIDTDKPSLVDCISKNDDHHSFVYHILRTNPELCDVQR